jgi:hypothetical protein
MGAWLCVQWPPYKQDRIQKYTLNIIEGTRVKRFLHGDLVYIYETGESGYVEYRDGNDSEEVLELIAGRKGIIAVAQVSGEFTEHRWTANKRSFIGHFDLDPRLCCKIGEPPLVSLDELRRAWQSRRHVQFNPRITGGIRSLTDTEYSILRELVGYP